MGRVLSFLNDEVLVVCSHICFFTFGWLFFRKKLFKDYEVKDVIVQFLFSSTFTLTCSMFQLIIFEITDFLNLEYAPPPQIQRILYPLSCDSKSSSQRTHDQLEHRSFFYASWPSLRASLLPILLASLHIWSFPPPLCSTSVCVAS